MSGSTSSVHATPLFPVPVGSIKPRLHTRGLTLALLALIVFLLALAGLTEILGQSLTTEWLLAGGAGLIIIVAYKRVLRLEWLSPTILYMAIFWVFHLGLVFPAAIVPSLLDDYPGWALDRLLSPESSIAVVASLLFLACFAVGTLFVRQRESKASNEDRKTSAPKLVLMGWLTIAGGMLLAVIALANYGFESLLSSYDEFFAISSTFAYAVVITAIGLILQIAGGRAMRSVLLTALWSYLPIAALTFLAGSRTAPLFTAIVILIALSKRGLRVSRLALGLGIITLLIVTATIREVRQVGLGNLFDPSTPIAIQSPLSGLTELGGSLQPVISTVDYMRSHDFFVGETYVFPVLRQIDRLFGGDIGTPDTDPRFIANRIVALYGSIGYSTVAEAYANGGLAGVLIFALLWGVVFGLLERHSNTPYRMAVFLVILIPMMINIRNSFIYVPAWIFLGLCPVLVAKFLDLHAPRRY